jgi:hypothetical protein
VKKMSFSILMALMLVISMQIAAPAMTPKLMDSGSSKFFDPITEKYINYSWKAYQFNKNNLIVKFSVNWYGAIVNGGLTLKKIGPILTSVLKIEGNTIEMKFMKTPLTAALFYWRVIKPAFNSLLNMFNIFVTQKMH